jgi:ATP-dependent Clp protease ATP-binding subunit ClpB
MVIFTPLNARHLSSIVRLQTAGVAKRLAERDIELSLTDAAALSILSASYDVAYGARPLKRYIEKNVVTQVSRLIVAGQLLNHSKLVVDVSPDGKNLLFKVSLRSRALRCPHSFARFRTHASTALFRCGLPRAPSTRRRSPFRFPLALCRR